MPLYLTWDPVRDRELFQIRVPVYAQKQLGNRKIIREHLGAIPRAVAVALAAQRAAYYHTLFKECAASTLQPDPVEIAPAALLPLCIDADVTERVVATWTLQQAQAFKERLDALRLAPSSEWAALEQELRRDHETAREDLRRHRLTVFDEAVDTLERRLHIRLDGSAAARDDLARAFNRARGRFLIECLAVLAGDQGVSALFPAASAQLPLLELWGDPASHLAEHWRESLEAHQCHVNPKTLDKYRHIAADLGTLLTRRPVQSLTPADVQALKHLWSARGNRAPTIKGKLAILRTLFMPFDPEGRLTPLLHPVRTGAAEPRAARLPFTESQIHAFLAAVFHSDAVRTEDQMLVALLVLTGARLEELCQLRAVDFETVGEGWIVRIADGRQTGEGNTRLKNSASARRLPLARGVFPTFDAWLTARLAAGGDLFPDLPTNKYGARGEAASKRLNALLRRLFPKDRRLVLQSTRNTAAREMRRAGTDPRVRLRFLGHADDFVHDRHYDPGVLLDDRDLASGAAAIVAFLREVLDSSATSSS